jgi:hypothetical protein
MDCAHRWLPMSNLKIAAYCLSTVIVATTGGILTRKVNALQQTPDAVTVQRSDTYYKFREGGISRQLSVTIAVRSDGSNVEIQEGTGPDGRVGKQSRIVDVRRKQRIIADGLTESVTTYNLQSEVLQRMNLSKGACSATDGSNKRVLLGYEVVRSTSVLGNDNGVELSSESWIAPQLNCLPLEETTFAGTAGVPPHVVSVKRVTKVAHGEPDESLFMVPINYVERSPSVVMAEYMDRYMPTKPSAAPVAEAVRSMDPAYNSSQRPD